MLHSSKTHMPDASTRKLNVSRQDEPCIERTGAGKAALSCIAPRTRKGGSMSLRPSGAGAWGADAGGVACPARSTALPRLRASPADACRSEGRLLAKPWPNAGGLTAADLRNGIAKRTGHIAAPLQPLSLNF